MGKWHEVSLVHFVRLEGFLEVAEFFFHIFVAFWKSDLRYGLFSVTSNIDGHWDRTEGVGPQKVYECHGVARAESFFSWGEDGQ